MKVCALCGTTLTDDSRFCPRCGVALGLTCSACRADNNPLAARCGRCGTALRVEPAPAVATNRAPRESRRIVTVLFADIVGYTSLVETQREPEVVRALMQNWFNALATDILDHGGIVEKFIGDAICALFGAPAVHEDDPQRALSCALSMEQTIDRLNQLDSEHAGDREPIQLRIGVATGEVVGGTEEQAGQEHYSVTGDAVNTASRLQAAAKPGQILVSASTEQLTRDQFVFEVAGPMKLKGKRAPVSTFRLLEPRHERDRVGAELVGRRRELDHLMYCLGLAVEGDCQLVEIIGDAGVGKSRLVDAFVAQIRPTTLVCRGDAPTSMTRPLHPLISIGQGLLSGFLQGEQDEQADQAASIVGELINETSATVGEVEDVAAAIQTLIRGRSRQGPIVIVLENVHRADGDSLDVLQRLIGRFDDERLLLLWTRRSGEELVVQGDSLAEYTRISLRPLSDLHAEELMRQLLDGATIPEPLEQRIIERSGGNPFFIEAMVRTIVDEDDLGDGHDAMEIPTTVQGLVQARLDSLPEPERLAAQEAAVAGREFDGKLLQQVDLFGIQVEDALAALSRRGMIDHVGGSTYRFRHVLTQEVCYETMLQALRSELHREIADTIVDLYPDRVLELAPYRADHYAKAGDTERAVEVLVEAGVSEA